MHRKQFHVLQNAFPIKQAESHFRHENDPGDFAGTAILVPGRSRCPARSQAKNTSYGMYKYLRME